MQPSMMKTTFLLVAIAVSTVAAPAPADNVVQMAQSAVGTPVMAYGTVAAVVAVPSASSTTQNDRTPDVADLPQPTNYCSTALYHYNIHRLNHSAPLVTYDQSVATYASTHIVGCPATLTEETGSNWYSLLAFGENTYNNAQITAMAIEDWYNEEPAYAAATKDYTVAPDMSTFEKWGHFSQMVWHAESTIGCWTVFCDASTPFVRSKGADFGYQVVCASSPAGNLDGASNYAANINRPLNQAADDYKIWNNDAC